MQIKVRRILYDLIVDSCPQERFVVRNSPSEGRNLRHSYGDGDFEAWALYTIAILPSLHEYIA